MCDIPNNNAWYFTTNQMANTPSIKYSGYDVQRELSCRRESANFIQRMGQTLKTSQLCINTAIVYMHRFYTFHSFRHFLWHEISMAALFLAAKVEEQSKGVKCVIRAANVCRNIRDSTVDTNSGRYKKQSQDLIFHEGLLLQTLGFDVAVDHPHIHIVRWCHSSQIGKELAQTSYFMASRSLHLTTMCIQYKPTVVACFCILAASKQLQCEIPLSNEGKQWYSYIDPTVTDELLGQLADEFSVVLRASPEKSRHRNVATFDKTSSFASVSKKIQSGSEKDSPPHRTSHETSSGHHRRERRLNTYQLRDRTNTDSEITRDQRSDLNPRDSIVSPSGTKETSKRDVKCLNGFSDSSVHYNVKKRRMRS